MGQADAAAPWAMAGTEPTTRGGTPSCAVSAPGTAAGRPCPTGDRRAQRLVGAGSLGGLAEQHVVDDGLGAGLAEPVDHPGVGVARPRPGAQLGAGCGRRCRRSGSRDRPGVRWRAPGRRRACCPAAWAAGAKADHDQAGGDDRQQQPPTAAGRSGPQPLGDWAATGVTRPRSLTDLQRLQRPSFSVTAPFLKRVAATRQHRSRAAGRSGSVAAASGPAGRRSAPWPRPGEQLEAVVAHAVARRAPAEQELAMLALAAVARRAGVQGVEVAVEAVVGREAFQPAGVQRGQADEIGAVGQLAEVGDRAGLIVASAKMSTKPASRDSSRR
jgi:hypothetical protein